jgi:hypothetical protein
MTNFVFNQALGRVVELYNNVDTGVPAASRLVIAILDQPGLETDVVLRDKLTLADIVSGSTNEAVNTGYARKVLTTADILAFAPDMTNNRIDLDLISDPTWLSVGAGNSWGGLVILYDPSSNGVTPGVMVPLTYHDFVVAPDGSNITAQIAASGFFRATSST